MPRGIKTQRAKDRRVTSQWVVLMNVEKKDCVKAKIHYISFPVASPWQVANLLQTCYRLVVYVADLLATQRGSLKQVSNLLRGSYGETGVMDFGLNGPTAGCRTVRFAMTRRRVDVSTGWRRYDKMCRIVRCQSAFHTHHVPTVKPQVVDNVVTILHTTVRRHQ